MVEDQGDGGELVQDPGGHTAPAEGLPLAAPGHGAELHGVGAVPEHEAAPVLVVDPEVAVRQLDRRAHSGDPHLPRLLPVLAAFRERLGAS